MDLYWLFDRATNEAKKEFGKWAIEALKKAAEEVLGNKPTKGRKTGV